MESVYALTPGDGTEVASLSGGNECLAGELAGGIGAPFGEPHISGNRPTS